MHHNVLGKFLDLRPAVFAAGSSSTSFRDFRYWTEAKVPASRVRAGFLLTVAPCSPGIESATC